MTSPTSYTPGPYDEEHLYAQWGGKLPGGEEWSNGIRFAPVLGHPVQGGDPVAMLPALTTAISAFHSRAATTIHNAAKLSYVKLNAITLAGTYMQPVTYEQIVADVPGGSNAPQPPNQVSLCVTWLTSFSRGPANKGRIYLPLMATTPAADGMIAEVIAQSIKGSADTFLADLIAVSADYEPAVYSRKMGAPAHNRIIDTAIGRVMDTQRRRRRSLAENYV